MHRRPRRCCPRHDPPRFLIRDSDAKFGPTVANLASGACIKDLRTPPRAPRANAICERFMGSLRRECLDHLLILNEEHLRRAVAEYVRYFNGGRPHQGLGQVIPGEVDQPATAAGHGEVQATPIPGGLHHDYRRAA